MKDLRALIISKQSVFDQIAVALVLFNRASEGNFHRFCKLTHFSI